MFFHNEKYQKKYYFFIGCLWVLNISFVAKGKAIVGTFERKFTTSHDASKVKAKQTVKNKMKGILSIHNWLWKPLSVYLKKIYVFFFLHIMSYTYIPRYIACQPQSTSLFAFASHCNPPCKSKLHIVHICNPVAASSLPLSEYNELLLRW